MDPFTQRILDRAEQRSKHLGISNTSKFPLTEINQTLSTNTSSTTKSPVRAKAKTPTKSPLKVSSNDNKNVVTFSTNNGSGKSSDEFDNISVEINITTDTNVGVKCDVITMDVDEDGNVLKSREVINDGATIRDSSKSRLQRLGALYSESQNLSSPIHRTENKFHEQLPQDDTRDNKRPKNRFGKLAELADSINNWENDTSHPNYKATTSQKENVPASPQRNLGAVSKKYQAPRPPTTPSKSPSKGAIPKSPRVSAAKPEIKEALTVAKGVIKKDSKAGETKSSPKQLKWDKSVVDALESQGFKRRQSNNTKLTFDYSENESRERENKMNEASTKVPSVKKVRAPEAPEMSPNKKAIELNKDHGMKDSPKKLNFSKGLVSGRAAMFENSEMQRPLTGRNKDKDPAEMSLKERMALFEKNKGEALIPKAAFAMSVSAKQITGAVGGPTSTSSVASTSSNSSQQSQVNNLSRSGQAQPPHLTPTKEKNIPVFNKATVAESKASGLGIKSTVASLLSGASTISESKIAEETKKQRQQEMDLLMNRFHKEDTKEKSPPPPPPMPSGSMGSKRRSDGNDKDDRKRDSDESKRVKTVPGGRLYPVLSDLDTSSSEQNYTTATISEDDNKGAGVHCQEGDDVYMDSDEEYEINPLDGSISRAVMNSIRYQNESQPKVRRSVQFDSSTSEVSDGLDEMDDYLDEALDDSNGSYTQELGRKGSISSNSFSYKKSHKKMGKSPIKEDDHEFITPVTSKMTVTPSKDDKDMMTLVHTVSFYRKQQQSTSQANTPRKVVLRNNNNFSTSTEEEESEEMEKDYVSREVNKVEEKKKKLYDEIYKQQQIISQTSQALNLCASTVEFSGSTESVEGERHLLVATHRRQALLNEVQRLAVEKAIRPEGAPRERGRLSVKDITLSLEESYIRRLSKETISGHHLVCLLKYGETVLATRSVPTLPGLKTVKFPDALNLEDVYADFKITLEIYGMTAQREVLPHDIKYHIANAKKQKLLTPKGKKGPDSRLLFMPPVQSPGGPGAVRTSSMVQYGFVIFSMRETQRTSWTLNAVSAVSPLEGKVHMKINCELSVTVDHRGFLTMFEDVSGLGFWHRRWCRLRGNLLSYWKYPDDEKKKAPIGSIDLYSCCSKKVDVAPRDISARCNTLLLELKRPSEEGEKESLVIRKEGRNTIVRHLLSTDTKEERDIWSGQFNKTLALLQAWGPPADE